MDSPLRQPEDRILGHILGQGFFARKPQIGAAQQAAGDAVGDCDQLARLRRLGGQPRADAAVDILEPLALRSLEEPVAAGEGVGILLGQIGVEPVLPGAAADLDQGRLDLDLEAERRPNDGGR